MLLSDGVCTHLNIPKHPDYSRAHEEPTPGILWGWAAEGSQQRVSGHAHRIDDESVCMCVCIYVSRGEWKGELRIPVAITLLEVWEKKLET